MTQCVCVCVFARTRTHRRQTYSYKDKDLLAIISSSDVNDALQLQEAIF